MKRFTFIFMAVGILYSCNQKNSVYKKPYFDFDSLVQKQTHLLLSVKSKMAKRTMLNEKKDSAEFVPDSAQWTYELDAFRQLDVINKPSYKNYYQQADGDDPHSNLHVKSFTSRIKSPVPELRFYFQDDKKLKKIEALYEEENLMMTTSRKLTLEFDGNAGNENLIRYFVDGTEKMLFSKPVVFSIEGKISSD